VSALLSISGLSVSFGGVAALEDVGFTAEAGVAPIASSTAAPADCTDAAYFE